MTTKIKRSLLKTFLNVGTLVAPDWALLGAGITTAKINMNPKTTEETYIHEDSGSTSVDSYVPTMPAEATAMKDDDAFEFIDALRVGRSVLGSAETEVVNVWAYKTPYLTYYAAEKQSVSIQVDDFGGDGGVATKINFTINYIGEPVLGTFSPSDLEFVPDPILTKLATLSVEGLTLTPVFNQDWLWYSLSTALSAVTLDSTVETVGATVIQKNGVTVVNQGADATLAMGLNVLTFEVTNGTEVSTYRVEVTRT